MITDQPMPNPNTTVPIWDLVIADMKARDRVGRERYGTPLQPSNGRDALVDAYQEALDLAVYLRQAIEERKAVHQSESEELKAAAERWLAHTNRKDEASSPYYAGTFNQNDDRQMLLARDLRILADAYLADRVKALGK